MATTVKPLMECGHTANAVTQEGAPVCIIDAGIVPGAYTVAASEPDLTGRMMTCNGHRGSAPREVPSRAQAAFFKHQPDNECDSFYCGCWGWN